jgi:hypothetical protein
LLPVEEDEGDSEGEGEEDVSVQRRHRAWRKGDGKKEDQRIKMVFVAAAAVSS